MWLRAHQTLGDVTLTAITDRVLYVAAEQHSLISALRIETSGLRCQELYERAPSLRPDQLEAGVRFVLVEFLTVLGNLTAEILTPALHAELSNVGCEEQEPDASESPSQPLDPERDREDATS